MGAPGQSWTSGEARAAAKSIVRALRDGGHTAYFAGGCVRDELLGIEPVDYDVATDARPDRIQSLFRRTAAVGASFGVILVKERGVTVEVATFRSDGPYSDKRRPDSVQFSDAEHDAQRRDFTINALFLDPMAADDSPTIHGHAIDLVGGLPDLEAGIVRAVGDPETRLAEDHLRALRAVRFAARYGFEIESGTASAIAAHAAELSGVSRERIGDEVRRMMTHPARANAADLLAELRLASVVLQSEASPTAGRALETLRPEASLPAALAAWLFDRGEVASAAQVPEGLARWRRALCLSNGERDRLRDVLHGVLSAESDWTARPVAARKRAAASGWFEDALDVLAGRNPGLAASIEADVAALRDDGVGLAPAPFLDGDDLIRLGLEAGPVFGRALAAVYDAQLEGEVRTKAEAENFVLELARSGGV